MSASAPRPLSPHLQIYKKQLSAATSIFHRMTGVSLTLGLPVLALWLVSVADGGECYAWTMRIIKSCIGQIFLLGWTWALFYHLSNGIRHLLWDTGHLLEMKDANRAGLVVIGASVVLTAFVWLNAYGIIP